MKHGSYNNNFGVSQTIIEQGTQYKPIYELSIRFNFKNGDRGTQNMRGNK